MADGTAPLAKITRPRLGEVAARKRLFAAIDAAGDRSVVWVMGPAGSGKTTLVASYLDARSAPALWYQIDGRDGDIAAFFYYLGLAAQRMAPDEAPALPLFTPEYLLGLPTFTRNYFERLFALLPPSFVVVLDDYHEAPAGSALHEVIRLAAEILPEGGRVIALSREPPPQTLSRLRLNRGLAEVGWQALRLTEEETRTILALQGRKPSEETVITLHQAADGWVAGLRLLAERGMKRGQERPGEPHEPTMGRPDDGTAQLLFDYFAGEVFDRQASDVQDFLLQIALMPETTAQAAADLTGRAEAGDLLEALQRSHYFTERRDHPEAAFRLHPLFRDFLLHRGKQVWSGEERTHMLVRAAQALEEMGEVEVVLALYQEAKVWPEAVRLICQHAPALLAQGRCETVSRWIDEFPASVVDAMPWLRFWHSACRLPFNPTEAQRQAEVAFEGFEAQGDAMGSFLAWGAVTDAIIQVGDDFGPIAPWVSRLEQLLESEPTFPTLDVEGRVVASALLGLVFGGTNDPNIRRWAVRATDLLQSPIDSAVKVQLAHHLIYYHVWWGDLGGAAAVVEAYQGVAGGPDAPPLVRVLWRCAEGLYLWAAGRIDHSLQVATEGLETARETGVHLWDLILMGGITCCCLCRGDLTTAGEFLRRIAGIVEFAGRRFDRCFYHVLAGWRALEKGDLPVAVEECRIAVEQSREFGAPFWENSLALYAMALFEQGDREEALGHLAKARQSSMVLESHLLSYTIDMVTADLAFASGNEAQGHEALRRGLVTARLQRRPYFIGFCPQKMADLCVRALTAGIEVDFVRELIRDCELVPEEPPVTVEGWPWPVRVFTLGGFRVEREGEPLRFTGKAQRRPVDLLRALVGLGGRDVSQWAVCDALWPDADEQAGYRSLATTLHRLRNLLGHEDAIDHSDGRLTLNPRLCWVDVWAFERCLENSALLEKVDVDVAVVAEVEKGLALYRGEFMGDEGDGVWVISPRERFRAKFLRGVTAVARHWEQAAEWQRAVAVYERGLEADDLAEELYRGLMRCCQQLGRRSEAAAVYRRCRDTLGTVLGLEPSPETERLYQTLRA